MDEVMVQSAVPVPAGVSVESTALAVKENVPLTVGVPVMLPEALSSVSTDGKKPVVME